MVYMPMPISDPATKLEGGVCGSYMTPDDPFGDDLSTKVK